MSAYTHYTIDDAPEESRETLRSLGEQSGGFVPNILRLMAESPATLSGVVQLQELLASSTLTKTEQKLVLLTAAYQMRSDYCVAANSTLAKMSEVEDDIITALRLGEPLPDSKLEVLRKFTMEMVSQNGRVSDETKETFFNAGFTKENHLEVILGIATETFGAYTARSTGVPVDEQFQSYAWSSPESVG